VLVRQANQEICLGRNLAGRIMVEEAQPTDECARPCDRDCGLDLRGRGA